MSEELGKRDQRIAIQRVTETTDSEGNPVKSWVMIREVWASFKFINLRVAEVEMSGRVVSTTRLEFTTNYRSDLTEKDRISWRSDFWNIHEINPTTDLMDMKILTTRVR